MATKFDIEERWPELFVQLDETQRRAVVQSLASAWHEGWTPNREDVAVARCTVERLMRAAGIQGIRRDKTRKTTFGDGAETDRPADLVKRAFTICSNPACGKATPPHRACQHCGFYRGREVLPPRGGDT